MKSNNISLTKVQHARAEGFVPKLLPTSQHQTGRPGGSGHQPVEVRGQEQDGRQAWESQPGRVQQCSERRAVAVPRLLCSTKGPRFNLPKSLIFILYRFSPWANSLIFIEKESIKWILDLRQCWTQRAGEGPSSQGTHWRLHRAIRPLWGREFFITAQIVMWILMGGKWSHTDNVVGSDAKPLARGLKNSDSLSSSLFLCLSLSFYWPLRICGLLKNSVTRWESSTTTDTVQGGWRTARTVGQIFRLSGKISLHSWTEWLMSAIRFQLSTVLISSSNCLLK